MVVVSQLVQLVLIIEQVKQGDRQPKQLPLTRKRAVSAQDRQVAGEVQVEHGCWHSRHVLVLVSG
jgi:hypothetical protein